MVCLRRYVLLKRQLTFSGLHGVISENINSSIPILSGHNPLNNIHPGVSGLFTELSPSWRPPNCAATQELSSILSNPEVHYSVHKSPLLATILSQISPYHPILSLRKLSTHLCLGLTSGLRPSGFPTNILYAFLFAPFVLHAPPISSFLTWLF
jgi:hypothetical protein